MQTSSTPPPSALYPPIEPSVAGWLDVGDGHRVYWEQSGSATGIPVLFLHGGPGSSTKSDHRRYFDPARYRIVLFDQRGCGRSTPAGHIEANTTQALIADMERLREHLGIDRWIVFGGSWGSTLGLAYAQAHPARVMRMILRGIFLASEAELEWYFVSLRNFIPQAWESLWSLAPGVHWRELVSAYAARITGSDTAVALEAAERWNAYETAIMSIGETAAMPPASPTDAGALARARVQVHYLDHACFLAPDQLLAGMPAIAHIPALLHHGGMDFVCPPVTAHELARRWPSAALTMHPQAKHASSHPALERALVDAADRTRDLLGG